MAVNKEEGIKKNTTATGRVLGVVPVPGTSFCRIAYVDKKEGRIPDKWAGKYTSAGYAQRDIETFVAETWDVAEENVKKRA